MARSRFIYTLKEVAGMIGENLELIEEVTANSDNIAEGELIYVRDGSEDGTKGLTENGIDDLQSLLVDIRTWDSGIVSSSSTNNAIPSSSSASWQMK